MNEIKRFANDRLFLCNSDYDRSLTDCLYGGDSRYRLCQETILGSAESGCWRRWGLRSSADQGGKEVIRHFFQISEKLNNQIKVAYLENYDMLLGRMITSGVDVWLNTPSALTAAKRFRSKLRLFDLRGREEFSR